jgi:formate dehydrogenase maturation protein FdhE
VKNKNMKPQVLLSVFIICFIFSCKEHQPKEAQEFNKKMEQTIAIHDQVMPKMSDINQLLNQLENQIDSTNRAQIESAMQKLQDSHESMMKWMKSFGDEFSKTEINQGIQTKNVDSLQLRLKALEKYNIEAKNLKKHISEAIENANALIEKES